MAGEGTSPRRKIKMNNNSKGAISIRNVTKIYDPDGVNVMAVDDYIQFKE